VRLFHGPSGELLATAPGHEGAVRALAVAPDGQTVASAGEDAMVRVLPLSYEAWLRRACALSVGRDDADIRRLCSEP
jgi:WD40 repeat protein